MGYIDAARLERLAAPLAKSRYGKYLLGLVRDNDGPSMPYRS